MNARNRTILCAATLLAMAPLAWAQPFRVGGRMDVVIRGGHDHGVREWVPGHYETRYEQQVMPGGYRRVWVPPICETVCGPFGRHEWIVRPGHYRLEWVPDRVVTVERQVWVPGYYRIVHRPHHPRPIVTLGGVFRF